MYGGEKLNIEMNIFDKMNPFNKGILFILALGLIPTIICMIIGCIIILLSSVFIGPLVLFLYLQGLKETRDFVNSLNMKEWKEEFPWWGFENDKKDN